MASELLYYGQVLGVGNGVNVSNELSVGSVGAGATAVPEYTVFGVSIKLGHNIF